MIEHAGKNGNGYTVLLNNTPIPIPDDDHIDDDIHDDRHHEHVVDDRRVNDDDEFDDELDPTLAYAAGKRIVRAPNSRARASLGPS